MNSNFNLDDYIMHHVLNSHEWVLPFASPIPLPGILSTHALMIMIGCAIILMLFLVFYRKNDRIPSGLTNCLEALVVFVRDEVAVPNLGEKDGLQFTPMLCTIFFFILTLNLLGLVPFFRTATSNINVTFSLAFLIFVLLIFGTIARNGFKGIWHALIPAALPKWFIPLFLIIEIASIIARSVALMIRLFANMIAGHMVILSFLGLVIMFGWIALPAVFLAVFIYCLEVFISLLQAYIFILLSAVFIGQMYHPDH
jgi:F-type H+-transporting ATPase subunit a